MPSQEYMGKMQVRQNYRNLWHTDLMSTISADTPSDHVYRTCFGREPSTMICQGILAVLVICPAVVGVVKVVALNFALPQSSFNSLHVANEFNLQTTQCDNCIIGFMFFLQQLACIFSIVAMIVGSKEISEASQILSCLADMGLCVYAGVLSFTIYFIILICHPCFNELQSRKITLFFKDICKAILIPLTVDIERGYNSLLFPCLLESLHSRNSQIDLPTFSVVNVKQKVGRSFRDGGGSIPAYFGPCEVEMDKRDGMFGPQPMAVPPMQNMSHLDQPYPPQPAYGQQPYGYLPPLHAQGYPPAGYPPPHAQGYPPAGYPPPQAQGYPPAGYPK